MIKKIAATPYNARESLGWIIRNLTGFSSANKGGVKPLASPYVFNDGVKCRYRLAVIGDISSMGKNRLKLDDRLKEFLSPCDYVIGNFEGTITKKRPSRWPIAFDQRHDAAIIGDLAAIFKPDRTYLSVSNNHAGDFKGEFFSSVGILKSAGFNVFGWDEAPFADIGGDLRVTTGTMWSNREFARMLKLDKAKDRIKPGAFNLLYPHMGYELELYPRPEMVAFAEDMASAFDAVIASHPHCPQPVTSYRTGGLNKPVAYSLGDFCCDLKLRTMQYGLVIKLEVGRDSSGRWAAGKAEWQDTECVALSSGEFTVRPLR